VADRENFLCQEIAIACCLSDEQLRLREATLIQQFKTAVSGTVEIVDGYSFQLSGDKATPGLVQEILSAERECCPFCDFS
jgi:hypothetical protein